MVLERESGFTYQDHIRFSPGYSPPAFEILICAESHTRDKDLYKILNNTLLRLQEEQNGGEAGIKKVDLLFN